MGRAGRNVIFYYHFLRILVQSDHAHSVLTPAVDLPKICSHNLCTGVLPLSWLYTLCLLEEIYYHTKTSWFIGLKSCKYIFSVHLNWWNKLGRKSLKQHCSFNKILILERINSKTKSLSPWKTLVILFRCNSMFQIETRQSAVYHYRKETQIKPRMMH